MVKVVLNILSIFLFFNSFSAVAGTANVNGIRFWQDPEKTRLVFDVSKSVKYNLFTLNNPYRLVIDITDAALKTKLDKIDIPPRLIKKIRSSRQKNKLRLVIELKNKITTKDFTLKPFQNYGHRLVVDLQDSVGRKQAIKTVSSRTLSKNRDIIIAIDAGHGGEDPGASGRKKTREKSVTLAVAKRLAKMIDAEKGMKAVLTRKGDYYVSLRKRTDIARKNKADLFISIHADAFTNKKVKGASVWVLSPRGASSEMGRWLEQKEKLSDLAGGADISHKDPLVAEVLLDLSMHYSVVSSIHAAEKVYKALKSKLPKMHKRSVQKAAFVVLKMPDIPAMLVEMAFISNPTEEKLLKTARQQKKISKAILSGVKAYFKANPPDGSYYASQATIRSYRVQSGDTLSGIAQTFGVSIKSIKSSNRLKSSVLKVGQTLTIPKA